MCAESPIVLLTDFLIVQDRRQAAAKLIRSAD